MTCQRCAASAEHIAGVQYSYDHPEHYDGVSEWVCLKCGLRVGRWTGKILTGGATEPRFGVEREPAINAAQAPPFFAEGTQPR